MVPWPRRLAQHCGAARGHSRGHRKKNLHPAPGLKQCIGNGHTTNLPIEFKGKNVQPMQVLGLGSSLLCEVGEPRNTIQLYTYIDDECVHVTINHAEGELWKPGTKRGTDAFATAGFLAANVSLPFSLCFAALSLSLSLVVSPCLALSLRTI